MKDIKKSYKSQQVDVMINLLEHNIDEKKKILHTDTYLCNGTAHKFNKMMNGKAVTDPSTKKKIDTHLTRYRLSTLNEAVSDKRHIIAESFKDYTTILKSEKIALSFAIIFYLIMGGCAAVAALFNDKPLFFYPFLGGAILSFIIATILLILYIAWRAMLKKRKLRID